MPRVLITGGTGGLGSELVPRFAAAGYTVRILSRRARSSKAGAAYEWAQGDLVTGAGLAEAVAGCDLVVHCATNAPSGKGDAEGTRNLCAAAKETGNVRVFYISIVGIDRIPLGYYKVKLAAEKVIEESDVPYSILRATQFHTLIDRFLGALVRLPIALLPADFKSQPIDAGEVAQRMVEYAAEGPGGRLPDLGGPQVLTFREMARAWLRARGRRALLVPLPLPGKIAAGFRRGYNCAPDRAEGRVTWAEWLARTYKDQT